MNKHLITLKRMIGISVFCFSVVYAKNYFGGTYCKVTRDLNGKIAIITGGNTGIGKQTAIGLAKQGCQVIIAGRNVQKSLQAVSQIKEKTKNNKVHFLPLDLGSRQSIDDFVQGIKQDYSQIDILVNNAGVMGISQRKETLDNYQMHFGINHLGHFYLTSKLWDLLKKSKELRIINVSSNSNRKVLFDKNRIVDFDWKNLNFDYEYHSGLAYSRSKLANILFTQQLARKISKIHPNARCVSLHPGVVRTQIGRYVFQGPLQVVVFLLKPLFNIVLKSPWQGAQTTLYTVFQDSSKLLSGQYFSECAIDTVNKNLFANNPDNQKILWKFSEKMLGIEFNPD